MIIEGETYESKRDVRFKVIAIDHIQRKASVVFLDSGCESTMDIQDIEKSIKK